MKKKYLKILSISMIIICLLGLGISFGYFLISRVQDNNNIAGTKCFKLELSNSKNEINLTNMYPISDEEGRKLTPYSFTITNTCDMLSGYTVNMEMLDGTTLNSKYLDVMVNNEEIKLLNSYEETSTVIDGSTEARILAKGTLAYNDTIDYTVRFWMDKDVEDVDAMNKYFASKIVIDATPSSWNPKEAGYDTLHDAVLANEYQTSPEDALKKIEAKGTPDLSNTAPIIKWVEKTGDTTTVSSTKPASTAVKSDDATSDLTENDTKITLFTSVSFNSNTGIYTLSNPVYVDPTTIDFSGNTKYYYQNEYVSYSSTTKKLFINTNSTGMTIYQVKKSSKSNGITTWNGTSYNSITYYLNVITLTEIELETDKSDKGLYQGTDDYGTTYYYRGNVKNNNVYFAGFYWQIVRINGDGSIRLIYNGTEKNAIKSQKTIGTSKYNTYSNNPIYVGYMYGDILSDDYSNSNKNENSSSIKIVNDNWYKQNIADKHFEQFIADAGFCNDRSLSSGDGYTTNSQTEFNGYIRNRKSLANFSCNNMEHDLFTLKTSKVGNKALTYPIGLITYDELKMAGLSNSVNRYSYISADIGSFSMTPTYYSKYWATSSLVNYGNNISTGGATNSTQGVRPVINLKSDVKITEGIGTSNDPYVIETN